MLKDVNKGWTVPSMLEELTERQGITLWAKKPAATLGLIFVKLKKRGIIRIARRGAGRIPHIYKGVAQQGESAQ